MKRKKRYEVGVMFFFKKRQIIYGKDYKAYEVNKNDIAIVAELQDHKAIFFLQNHGPYFPVSYKELKDMFYKGYGHGV